MKHDAIDYDFGSCALGLLLVAGTTRGVCFVRLGEDAAALELELRDEFPFARVRRPAGRNAPVRDWREAIERAVSGEAGGLDVPLDVRGSVFQKRVWNALRAIPRGETRGYGELAAQLGQANGARAVARACATNPAWIVTPCHRVIAADGSLGGYAGGVQRKRGLLQLEGALAEELAAS
jgi:AraC family transcriptional regulator of adaptative response/methylated-DNA-[protein]-cysteine methyltransferase